LDDQPGLSVEAQLRETSVCTASGNQPGGDGSTALACCRKLPNRTSRASHWSASGGTPRAATCAAFRLDIHLVGAGNSAGQAAVYFANHARTVTLLVRGDSLEKSMSHYLIEQLHRKSNVAVQLRSEIHAVHGDTHLTAIDIRDSASQAVRRHDCGGLFRTEEQPASPCSSYARHARRSSTPV